MAVIFIQIDLTQLTYTMLALEQMNETLTIRDPGAELREYEDKDTRLGV